MSDTREVVETAAGPVAGGAASIESSDAAGEAHPEARRALLPWAPPGLERMQGDLWLACSKALIAGAVLAIPLVLALTLPHSPLSVGPLGRAWWIPLLTTLNGLILFTDAAVTLFRLLRRSLRAVREGYTPRVVGMVLSDRTRDAGFLLQGARVYSELSEQERRLVSVLRLWVPTLYLLAGHWLSVAFGALALLAARGVVSPVGVATGTLVPPVLFFTAGVVCSAVEASLLRKARRAWYRRPWTQDLAVADAAAWRAAAAAAAGEPPEGPRPLWLLKAAMATIVLAGVVAVLPPATLVPASSLGAVMSSVGSFPFGRTQARLAAVEIYRPYRLEADPSVTAAEAGVILHALTYVGRAAESVDGLLPPARVYEASWYPTPPMEEWRPDVDLFWADSVWSWAARGMRPNERAYLTEAAAHPARAEFSRLAYAAAADVVAGRYVRPFGPEDVYWAIPIPRYDPLRRAANVHIGTAALRLAEGRPDEAERLVREVISVGFLLMDDSPLLIGAQLGRALAERGGLALERVLRASGRSAEADVLAATAAASQRAVSLASPGVQDRIEGQAFLENLPLIVADTAVNRSMRWEYLGILSALTPCLNLQRVVFGPGEDHEIWLADVRERLVRFPADRELFDLMVRGFGTASNPGALARLMAVSMGGMDRPGSCAQLIATLPSIM